MNLIVISSKIYLIRMDKPNNTYLITTGLKKSWPKHNYQKNYLGSWCFNTLLEENDKIVFKHPWDNRELYFEDYKYISQLNETFLNSLSVFPVPGGPYVILLINNYLFFFFVCVFQSICQI